MAKIEALLKLMHEKGGSDLHLSPGHPPMLRETGDLNPLPGELISNEECKTLLYEIMGEAQRKTFEENLDFDFAYEVGELNCRFRVNVFNGRHGISAVFRLIPTVIPTATELGLPDSLLNLTRFSSGLVIVAGPAGNGKTTTQAAMIDHINETRKDHILTIEDPVEFVHVSRKSLINQREVGRHTRSFSSALKAALREDPDVILVGGMPDLETIELAITAAETGHLVFGTLPSNSAAKTIDRLVNVFPTHQQEQIRAMLGESLKGVIVQQLLKTTDGKRCAALEILTVNPAVSNLIREGKTFQIPSLIQTGDYEGMQLMDHAIQRLYREKRISAEEARKHANNKNLFPTNAEVRAA